MSRLLNIALSLAALGAVLTAGDITGKVAAGKGASVVYVEAVGGKTFPAPAAPLQMDQKSLLFQPHLLVAPVGATVEFLNSDKVQHNIFWPAINGNKKLGHNMGTWPTGEKRAFKFETPGIVPLLCNVHPEMSGYIIVTPTPYYAETDASGSFKISNVPDGAYTVTAWHEGYKNQSKPVTVAGQATVEFSLAK
ncbi:MAG TPA: carboxypeptidase regulatory-like domain-containing protein [Bryobacteraceae bacterium]|nr:carboxypeptidase regulatory-like domain-containing protein [Bryobacteraceae bacterium]